MCLNSQGYLVGVSGYKKIYVWELNEGIIYGHIEII